MTEVMPVIEWPLPGYPFESMPIMSPQENLGWILANTFLQDLAAELDRHRRASRRRHPAERHITPPTDARRPSSAMPYPRAEPQSTPRKAFPEGI